MLHTTVSTQGCGTTDRRPKVARTSLEERRAQERILALYVKAWADGDPAQILYATDPAYRFHDPLVGNFSRLSLPLYFERLQSRFARAEPISQRHLGFHLHGPMDRPTPYGHLEFWREAPSLGLTGVTQIKAGPRGVVAETVAYDLNLATGVLSTF